MLKNLGQVGTRMRPDIFDDGTLCEQPFRKLKAFTDVGNIESMSKERWGAAKWVRGQARIYCSNDFEVSKEPECTQPIMDAQRGLHSYISRKDFATMLELAWRTKDLSNSNVMAILKRTHIIVNTSTALCNRPFFWAPRMIAFMRTPAPSHRRRLSQEGWSGFAKGF